MRITSYLGVPTPWAGSETLRPTGPEPVTPSRTRTPSAEPPHSRLFPDQ